MVADLVRVEQIVVNLLANAAKYREAAGCMRLAVEATAEVVTIEARDNGIGLPADLLPRVFDLFEQGGEAQHRGWCGLGIGVALVKCLVEPHLESVSAQTGHL